jgi:hypothetical protein
MKFLIDECLSPALTVLAHWTFVTRNAIDFRGPAGTPGSKGEYASVELHAGLICLNASGGMDLGVQKELFRQALDELDRDPDLINQVLEITIDQDSLLVRRYRLPAG